MIWRKKKPQLKEEPRWIEHPTMAPTEPQDMPPQGGSALSDYAGPRGTFPIRTQEDIKHALRLLEMLAPDLEDPATIYTNIRAIARHKGLILPQEEDATRAVFKMPDDWDLMVNALRGGITMEEAGQALAPRPRVDPRLIGDDWW